MASVERGSIDSPDLLYPEHWADPAYVGERRAELTQRFRKNMAPSLRAIIELYKPRCGVWLIGSTIPLTIGGPGEGCEHRRDYDLITRERIPPPPGFIEEQNRYGNPKHRKGNLSIDAVPLKAVYSIKRRNAGLPPAKALGFTIGNWLTGTPLAHQSIAYDLQKEELIGDIGVFAIATRTVFPNDVAQLAFYASRKGKRPNQIIREHAARLRYTPLYCCEPLVDVFLPPCSLHPAL